MAVNVALPQLAEEEAYNFLLSSLRSSKMVGEVIDVTTLIHNYLDRRKPANTTGGMVMYRFDAETNAQPFYSAVWRLCTRGVLAPAPSFASRNVDATLGTRFVVTEYGSRWLTRLSDLDVVPSEYGRFSQLLANHDARLGKGYRARSQEALRCYQAHTYLACCAMCGAAAESVTLALAIAKQGDEAAVIRDYGSSGGRGKIERFLLANQDGHITKNLPNYLSLLNDWRDAAAHGNVLETGEEEAFTALLLLLRYARFADERWDNLTGVSKTS